MAGHNKWSKIKRKKAKNDVARAREHTKAARAIEAASRLCQGDLADLQLQTTISAARSVQLPKERIERAIERGANPQSKSEGEEYLVRRYDGMVPAGSGGKVAVIIETLTENKNRTAANVRNIVTTKCSGELLPTGANDWMFEHVGLIWVSKYMNNGEEDSSRGEEVDIDALLECSLEGGATDVEFDIDEEIADESDDEDNAVEIVAVVKCEPNDLLQLVKQLKADGYVTTQFENQWLVRDEGNKVLLDDEGSQKIDKFLSLLDDDLDVTNVFHNALSKD